MLNKIKSFFGNPDELSSHEGFHRFYQKNKDFIRSSIYWMVRSEDIDDLVHDSFVKAWRGRQSFHGNSSLRTWLYRIAINCAKDHLRKKQENFVGDFEETPSPENSSNPDLKDLIDKGLLEMNLEQREAFILFYKMELSLKEIAELQGVPLGTVKSRLNKAKTIFMKFVETQEVIHAG